jgi:hypothetical protein
VPVLFFHRVNGLHHHHHRHHHHDRQQQQLRHLCRHRLPTKLREQPDGGLLDKLVFGVGVGHEN